MSATPLIGVVGLGTMGLGLVQVFAQAGFSVCATDTHPPARETARARLGAALEKRVAAGKLSQEQCDAILARVTLVEGPEGMAQAGLVIEAVLESLDAKATVFADLEAVLARDAVLATNTSSLSVAAIAAGLAHPERLVGLHFFNPAPVMALVELIAHPRSSPQALALARAVTQAAGKTVIACADRPGFIVNRCARPYYGEALALLEEGRAPGEIDAAMMAAGYRLGPFALIDLVGVDINLAATKSLAAAMDNHPRYHVFAALEAQVAAGHVGRKSGRGFVFPDAPVAAPGDAADIVLRIEAALANEAASLLDEGAVDAKGIDQAMKLGLNFPRGPLEAARAQGFDRVRARLADLESHAPDHLRGRYVMSPALEAMNDE